MNRADGGVAVRAVRLRDFFHMGGHFVDLKLGGNEPSHAREAGIRGAGVGCQRRAQPSPKSRSARCLKALAKPLSRTPVQGNVEVTTVTLLVYLENPGNARSQMAEDIGVKIARLCLALEASKDGEDLLKKLDYKVAIEVLDIHRVDEVRLAKIERLDAAASTQ